MTPPDASADLDSSWFEMTEIRKRKFANNSWIPLRAKAMISETGKVGYSGYRAEFFGCATAAFPLEQKDSANKLTWATLNLMGSHAPWVHEGHFFPSDVYSPHLDELEGLNLVMVPRDESGESEWIVHPDLILGLSLVRKGNTWVSPNEGLLDVIRLRYDSSGFCEQVEIRASHLKDYLCARKMGLRICSYHSREAYSSHRNGIDWTEDRQRTEEPNLVWEGRVPESLEGGGFPGMSVAVIHVERTDLDPDDENPVLAPPSDENTSTTVHTSIRQGTQNFRIEGYVHLNGWIEPGNYSRRVLYDPLPPTVFFTTDSEGNRQSKETLLQSGRWLWFEPEVIRDLLDFPGSALRWSGREVGLIDCSNSGPVLFGVNLLGLLTVFAEDMATLPDWQQQVWAGHGVTPEGKLSLEQFTIQVRGRPINSKSPEDELKEALERIRVASESAFGCSILRAHPDFDAIADACHRFRGTDDVGLGALAKDIARITADSFDAGLCITVAPLPKGVTSLKGNKAVENLMASKIGKDKARALMGPLVGIYDLRLTDAHLPGQDAAEAAYKLIGIDPSKSPVHQAIDLIDAAAKCLGGVAGVLENWNLGPE